MKRSQKSGFSYPEIVNICRLNNIVVLSSTCRHKALPSKCMQKSSYYVNVALLFQITTEVDVSRDDKFGLVIKIVEKNFFVTKILPQFTEIQIMQIASRVNTLSFVS